MSSIKYYDTFISLGLNCEVAAKIRKFCNTFSPTLFSWSGIDTLGCLDKALRDGIDSLLEETKTMLPDFFLYPSYGVSFHGRLDFRSVKLDDKNTKSIQITNAENEVICRISYLWKKFLNLSQSSARKLFILKIPKEFKGRDFYDKTKLTSAVNSIDARLRDDLKFTNFNILVVLEKGSSFHIDETENIYYRETELAPHTDALTNTNNAAWAKDVFSEFKVNDDERFNFLTSALVDNTTNLIDVWLEKKCDILAIDAKQTHTGSSLVKILADWNIEHTLEFLDFLYSNRQLFTEAQYMDAYSTFAKCQDNRKYMYIKRAIVMNQNNAQYHSIYCDSLLQDNNILESFEEAKICVHLEPGNSFFYYRLANICIKLKDFSAAAENYRKAIDLAPNKAEYHINYSHTLNELNQAKEAAREAFLAIELDRTNHRFYYHLANLNAKLKDFSSAAENYRKAIDLAPDKAEYHINYSHTLNELNQVKEAAREAFLATELDRTNHRFYYHLANLNAKLREFSEAAENYKKAIDLAPDKAEYRINYSFILKQLGN